MGFLKDDIEARVAEYDSWATRRQLGADGPNKRNLWVLGLHGRATARR